MHELAPKYCLHWGGLLPISFILIIRPIVIVVSYTQSEESQLTQFLASSASFPAVSVIRFPITAVSPINKMKNAGIAAVRTTHYVFAEFDLVPSCTFQKSLLFQRISTRFWNWRPGICGAIPTSSAWFPRTNGPIPATTRPPPIGGLPWNTVPCREFDRSPRGDKSIRQCLKEYKCRPIQTGTIPMVVSTFPRLMDSSFVRSRISIGGIWIVWTPIRRCRTAGICEMQIFHGTQIGGAPAVFGVGGGARVR